MPSRYKRNSYLSTISQMLSTGDIARVVDKQGRIFLELTSNGKRELKRRFSLFSLQDKKWDEFFMIVVFDIPEKDRNTRNRLRVKLGELGFGMLQKSVWISPYHFEEDLREYLVLNGLKDQVFVLSARKMWAGNTVRLAERVWKLKKINAGYKKVVKLVQEAKVLESKKRRKTVDRAYNLYLDTLEKDPLLPKELLPDYWARKTALKALNQALKVS